MQMPYELVLALVTVFWTLSYFYSKHLFNWCMDVQSKVNFRYLVWLLWFGCMLVSTLYFAESLKHILKVSSGHV